MASAEAQQERIQVNHYLIYLYQGKVVHIDNWEEGKSDPIGRDMVFEHATESLKQGPQLLPFNEGLAQIFDQVQKHNQLT